MSKTISYHKFPDKGVANNGESKPRQASGLTLSVSHRTPVSTTLSGIVSALKSFSSEVIRCDAFRVSCQKSMIKDKYKDASDALNNALRESFTWNEEEGDVVDYIFSHDKIISSAKKVIEQIKIARDSLANTRQKESCDFLQGNIDVLEGKLQILEQIESENKLNRLLKGEELT